MKDFLSKLPLLTICFVAMAVGFGLGVIDQVIYGSASSLSDLGPIGTFGMYMFCIGLIILMIYWLVGLVARLFIKNPDKS